VPRLAIVGGFDSLGRAPIDHAHNSPPLRRGRDDHFNRVRRGAINTADLGNFADAAEDVDRIAVPHRDYEDVSRGDQLRVLGGDAFKLRVIAIHPNEAIARRFVEGNAEFHLRDGVDDGFVEVLHGLDEMALANDQVPIRRHDQADAL